MRTITAPGVEITEYDKSAYSRSMTGTGCLVAGFAAKGEPYSINNFTTKSAWLQFYGEPQTEAEKYFYNAAVEVINQGGNLFCSKLPYDNAAYQKMVAVAYHISAAAADNTVLTAIRSQLDSSITSAYTIQMVGDEPYTIDLSSVDAYRTDELKPARGRFIIVDKTCQQYKKIVNGGHKTGSDREVIGILPVVTTAANALYAQNYLSVEKQNAYKYESIGKIGALSVSDCIDNNDCARPVNTANWYTDIQAVNQRVTLSAQLSGDATKCSESYIRETILDDINTRERVISSSWTSAYQINDTNKDIAEYTILSTELSSDWEGIYSEDKIAATFGWHNILGNDALPDTVSFEANNFFPAIQFDTTSDEADQKKLATTNLKKIGVVVYQMYIDTSNNNKIEFEPVESFAGSLCRTDVDPVTGASVFIDKIINANSNYINFFSNCFNTSIDKLNYAKHQIFIPEDSKGARTAVLGFTEEMTKKTIAVSKSIYDGLNKCFERCEDLNEHQIDIVIDAGIANIASFIKATYGEAGEYDLYATDDAGNSLVKLWKCQSNDNSVKTWKTIEQKFDSFCKNTRKDCMFIADGLRPLVLQGSKKIVRSTAPNNSIDATILPNVKWLTGLNTSYGAGYIDWFEVADEYTGDTLWLPPSIKAAGAYINTDINFNYWDAPAGLTRGTVAAADVAFSPTIAQAGQIYTKNWNYAVNYPNDGIVLEGQKTFQTTATAFDRVNVRRMFLRLERTVFQTARQFLYEGNTAYTRQRLIDAIDPYFKAAKSGGGIADYKIICDESINTAEVIDNNELRVKIGIIPVKTIEFIWVQFFALQTGGSFTEDM